MKRILIATCAIAALTGVAAAESHRSGKPNHGIREVDAASMIVTFYKANPADFRAAKMIGRNVYNLDNEIIGDVEDIIVDKGNVVSAIIVGVGGFLGVGERNVAISPSSMVMSKVGDSPRLVVNTTRDDLKNAPAFKFADVDKDANGGDSNRVNSLIDPGERERFLDYVMREHRSASRLSEPVEAGTTLPPTGVKLYPIPRRFGVPSQYRYAVVNDMVVLVDPSTKEIVEVVD